MKYLSVGIVLVVIGACARETEDAGEVVEEPAEEVYESVSDAVRAPLEEAAEVEALIMDKAEATGKAIEDVVEG